MMTRLSRTVTVVPAIVVMMGFASNVSAQERDWRFGAGIYGWLPTINGKLAYDVPDFGDQIEVDPGTLIDNLQFTIMAAAAVHHKKWSLAADVIYLKEAKNTSAQLDVGVPVTLDAAFKLKSWIVTPGVAYEAVRSTGGSSLAVQLGARYFYANTSLSLAAGAPIDADTTVEQSTHVWNGIVGVRGRLALSRHFYIPYYVDIGTGESDFTWQGLASITYDFRWGAVGLGYRYLSFDQGNEGTVRKLSFGGPELGVGFRF
ncbi:MAG: hypothetical protein PVJ43_11595 [Gemmatimonadales bacterium]|jgi:hypothetical protein